MARGCARLDAEEADDGSSPPRSPDLTTTGRRFLRWGGRCLDRRYDGCAATGAAATGAAATGAGGDGCRSGGLRSRHAGRRRRARRSSGRARPGDDDVGGRSVVARGDDADDDSGCDRRRDHQANPRLAARGWVGRGRRRLVRRCGAGLARLARLARPDLHRPRAERGRYAKRRRRPHGDRRRRGREDRGQRPPDLRRSAAAPPAPWRGSA